MRKVTRWLIIAAIIVVILSAFGVLQACNRSKESGTNQPTAGGAADNGSANGNVETGAATPEQDGVKESGAAPAAGSTAVEQSPTPPAFVFTTGDVYTATGALTIFATAASSSTVLDVYAPGEAFTVLEPNGDFSDYPVAAGGATWVRVRAQDGLAGWARASALHNE